MMMARLSLYMLEKRYEEANKTLEGEITSIKLGMTFSYYKTYDKRRNLQNHRLKDYNRWQKNKDRDLEIGIG